MRVRADVLVQGVHVSPALFFAKHLQPGAHVQKARAGRGRVGHDDLAGIHRLGQVLPRRGLGQLLLFGFDRVQADGGGVAVHADPGGFGLGVAHVGGDLVQALRGVGLQHAFLVHQAQRRAGQAPDHVGLGVVLLGQQLGGDDAGGVAHPLDLDVGIGLFEGGLVGLDLVGFQRRVDGQRGLGRGGAHHARQGGGQCKQLVAIHEQLRA